MTTPQELEKLHASFEERLQKLVDSFMEREFELKRGHQQEMSQMQDAVAALRTQLNEIQLSPNSRPPMQPSPAPLFTVPTSPPSTPKRSTRGSTATKTPASPATPTSTPARSARRAPPPSTPTKKSTPLRPGGGSKPTPSKVQPRRIQYKLSAQELKDPYIVKAREIVNLHVRMLASLDTAASVPKDPSKDELLAFYKNFSNKSESDIAQQLRSGLTLVPEELVDIKSYSSYTGRQKIRSALGKIEEHVIEYTRARLARLGFTAWTPNYNESAYALYNSAARMAALDTLKQALVSHAYAFTGVDALRLSKDMVILIKVYDHVVHHYFYDIYKKDKRDPGRVTELVGQSSVYTFRNRLSASRIKYLQSLSFPERLQKICTPKATSDDEEDTDSNGRKIYKARSRPERSVVATTLVRWIDEQIEKTAKMGGRMRSNRRVRVIPPPQDQNPTRFPTLPRNMPIDYFDPVYFNTEIPLSLRPQVADKTQLAFAHDANITFVEASRLSDAELMKRYGKDVVTKYTFLDEGYLGADEENEAEWLQDDEEPFDDDDFEMELAGEYDDNEAESVLDAEEEAEYVEHQRARLAAELFGMDAEMEKMEDIDLEVF
ncbi:hypothetical protein CVT24_009635 [Panaeolus cyanescens]|uniref:Uncharacterized protein n=1 Tax=Panaeolus cyanescens TaxID=181874 RepID=A0A409YA16_9AGAR|nr:hypothetical protein CVT24_009635 [Panaeolus cyanescens]